MRLDGATTYIDVGLTSDYYASGQATLTASAWFRATAAGVTGANLRIFSFQRSAGVTGWALETSNTTGFLQAKYKNAANANTFVTGTTALDTAWHLGTLVIDTTTITLYLDGRQEGTASDLDITNTSQADPVPAYLGSFDGSANTWDGALDDARLYLRALRALEVAALYNLGRQGDTGLLNRGPLINVGGINTAGFFHFMQ